jgi:Cys-tRNA(Pro)/Cys-tRNA(Cys) deacylase
MGKELKTNAMRILDKYHISYEIITYECETFIDGISAAEKSGIPVEQTFKTLIAVGKSGQYYVFVIPAANELDFKAAAKTVQEKSVELIPVKDITKISGYIRGGCSPIGMKKQYQTIIQKGALSFENIAISAGRIGTSVLLNPNDLKTASGAIFADIVVHS